MLLLCVLGGVVPAGSSAAAAGPAPGGPSAILNLSVTDWPSLGNGANHSGFTLAAGPPARAESSALPVSLGSSPFASSPVADRQFAYLSDRNGVLYALNRSAGYATAWARQLTGMPTTADLLTGRLVVGDGAGDVEAFGPVTGQPLWTDRLPGAIVGGLAGVGSTIYLAVANGTIGAVYALDATSGATDWSRPLGGPAVGAAAVEGATVFTVSRNGTVQAFSLNGTALWSRFLNVPVDAGLAVANGSVLVGDLHGNLTDLSAATGAPRWQWSARALQAGDAIEAAAATDGQRAYVETDLGTQAAIGLANGTRLWSHTAPAAGYAATAAPVVTPQAAYFISGSPTGTGALFWLRIDAAASGTSLGIVNLGASLVPMQPAIAEGSLIVGSALGMLLLVVPVTDRTPWPVTGTVENPAGAPVAGAIVTDGYNQTTTAADGTYLLSLSNGTYTVSAIRPGWEPESRVVTVTGPTTGVDFVIRPLTVYAVQGRVVDSASNLPMANVTVRIVGIFGYSAAARTGPDGAFTIPGPNGSDYLTADPPQGYHPIAMHVDVRGAAVSGVGVRLVPFSVDPGRADPWHFVAVLPLLVASAAAIGWRLAWSAGNRARRGLSSALLSPMQRFLAMRLALVPIQVFAVLIVLFVFGTVLPAAATHAGACQYVTWGSCDPNSCTWTSPACLGLVFINFLYNLATLNWGFASFGHLQAPATTFLESWLPDSLELAFVALAMSGLVAYFIGLRAGWRPGSYFDRGTRLASLMGLLLPTLIIVMVLFAAVYPAFFGYFGDAPYGTLPTPLWFQQHGGAPSWIGLYGNTQPTGFPIVDGLLHGDVAFAAVVAMKVILQAIVISVLYVAIFLRYARHVVAQVAREPHLDAARARGVPERTLLWRHTAREVWPVLLLVFGATLPVYLGTQALVEALTSAQGIGAILIAELTSSSVTRFGITTTHGLLHGNLYQVTVLLLALVVLLGRVASDTLARVLDPRLLSPGGRR